MDGHHPSQHNQHPGMDPSTSQRQHHDPALEQASSSQDDSHVRMEAPAPAIFASIDELLSVNNAFATSQGYKLVVVRSKTNTQGQKTWVQLACDRHGIKRNTHNLTEETRKKNRRSRRCECPMYCVATKTGGGLWELSVRNPEHNHGPYMPKARNVKEQAPPQHSSELVNLPLLQTPSSCIADFCLIPIGSANPSVSAEIAEIQRLIKRTGLEFTMHSAGTAVEGSWDDVMRTIGQCHSLIHGSGVVRIQTDIRVGSRTDKKQTAREKVSSVQHRLHGGDPATVGHAEEDDTMVDETSMTDATIQQMSHAMAPIQHAIAPGLDRMVPPPPVGQHPPMGHHLGHGMSHHPMAPHLQQHHMGPPRMSMP